AHVILLNVMPHSNVPMLPSTEAVMMRNVKEDYELLNVFNQQLEEAGVSTTVDQPQGSAVEVILEESEKESVDMIVMGSHGHGAVYNLLVGSVTSGVLKSSKCPVLVMPSPGK
ncbi:MAG: universal stress protein, partial [Chthoniobacteraceae bacterium]